jgi:hypothetical protein
MDNLLINCMLQQLYVGCAPVYNSPVYFYTHWVNTHIVCNTAWNLLFTINSYEAIKWILNNRSRWQSLHHNHHQHHQKIKNKKVKVPRNRPEGPDWDRGIALLFLDLGTSRGWMFSTTSQLLHPQKRPSTHRTGRWVGPRAILDVCEKFNPTGIWSPDHPAHSQLLYRLNYPGP